MPVGTRGAIKYLSAADYERLGAEIVLGNTYHLMLRPGAETVAALGGLGRFAGWDGLTLTDSGGFQVFSLDPKVDDDGVTFRSTYDGSTHRFTPETRGRASRSCSAPTSRWCSTCARRCRRRPTSSGWPSSAPRAWAERARSAPPAGRPGAVRHRAGWDRRDAARRERPAHRRPRLRRLRDRRAVSVGETRGEMLPALAAALADLPADRPRYLMGVGDPAAWSRRSPSGSTSSTASCRPGSAATARRSPAHGKLHVKNAVHARPTSRSTPSCACAVCARHSRGYLRHLFQVGEPTASRLVSLHNISLDDAADGRDARRRSAGTLAPFAGVLLFGGEPPTSHPSG